MRLAHAVFHFHHRTLLHIQATISDQNDQSAVEQSLYDAERLEVENLRKTVEKMSDVQEEADSKIARLVGLEFLVRVYDLTQDPTAREIADKTHSTSSITGGYTHRRT